MRLIPSEIKTITQVLTQYSTNGEIYLHGSRIDDNAKGGDIDLFFVISDQDYEKLYLKKYIIESDLSLKLNEQKIDLILIKKSEEKNHSFFMNSHKLKLSL